MSTTADRFESALIAVSEQAKDAGGQAVLIGPRAGVRMVPDAWFECVHDFALRHCNPAAVPISLNGYQPLGIRIAALRNLILLAEAAIAGYEYIKDHPPFELPKGD